MITGKISAYLNEAILRKLQIVPFDHMLWSSPLWFSYAQNSYDLPRLDTSYDFSRYHLLI